MGGLWAGECQEVPRILAGVWHGSQDRAARLSELRNQMGASEAGEQRDSFERPKLEVPARNTMESLSWQLAGGHW